MGLPCSQRRRYWLRDTGESMTNFAPSLLFLLDMMDDDNILAGSWGSYADSVGKTRWGCADFRPPNGEMTRCHSLTDIIICLVYLFGIFFGIFLQHLFIENLDSWGETIQTGSYIFGESSYHHHHHYNHRCRHHHCHHRRHHHCFQRHHPHNHHCSICF